MSGNCYQKAKGIFCPGYHSNPFQFSNYIELEHKSWQGDVVTSSHEKKKKRKKKAVLKFEMQNHSSDKNKNKNTKLT